MENVTWFKGGPTDPLWSKKTWPSPTGGSNWPFRCFDMWFRSLFVGYQCWKSTKAPSVKIGFVHILRLLLVVDKVNKESLRLAYTSCGPAVMAQSKCFLGTYCNTRLASPVFSSSSTPRSCRWSVLASSWYLWPACASIPSHRWRWVHKHKRCWVKN